MTNRVLRFDRGQIVGKLERTAQGYLRGDVIVTRTGIFNYRNDDGSERKELRHPDDVNKQDSLNTMRMIPITLNHPAAGRVTKDSAKSLAVGYTGENVRVDGKHIIIPVTITNADAIREVEAGKNQLSLGYDVNLKMDSGRYDDQKYDARQTDIVYDHLAIVDVARAGAATTMKLDGVTDASFQQDDLNYTPSRATDKRNDNQGAKMEKVRLDNGLEYDAAPEVAQELKSLRGRLDTLTSEKTKADAERDTAKGERDSFKAKLDKYEKDLPALIKQSAKERADIEAVADSHLDEPTRKKLDSMSNIEVMKAVILAVDKSAKLDGVSDDYIRGAFTGISSKTKKDSLGKQRMTVDSIETDRLDNEDEGDPREKMMKECKDAWKMEPAKK